MSQGSNFKKQVMEALFNAPTNLINNKAIMWAASNLPDEGGNGGFDIQLRGPYEHESDSFWTAIGMPGGDMELIQNKFRTQLVKYVKENQDSRFSKSMVFEHLEKTLGGEGMMYLAVHGFIKHYEDFQQIHSEISDLCDESEIPEHIPEELKNLLKEFLKFKRKLGGRS
jgi:hypothetical protein